MDSFVENGNISRHDYVYMYGNRKYDKQESVVSGELCWN